MKKKGFTLIELLAVIVLLAIITIIAVPKILNVIEKSKESSAESSIKLVKDAIKTQIVSGDALNESNFIKNNDGCYLFNFDDQSTGNSKELKLKNKEKISGSITYCNGKFNNDTLNFDGNRIAPPAPKIICKRATTLHTEECKPTAKDCAAVGYTASGSKGTTTITYGNLGNKGVLTSGDAFDCDVNGDGEYNPDTERFYYVSDYFNTSTKEFESDTATLIYYNNVIGGNSNNTGTYKYDSSKENWHGPRTAITQLPTTSQWSNVSLKSETRAILNENSENSTQRGMLPSNFDYTGYAARLLTIQELRNGTKMNNIPTGKSGELDNYIYLFENMMFSGSSSATWEWWLENPLSSDSSSILSIYDGSIGIDKNTASVSRGVRPAIEVSKVNISY